LENAIERGNKIALGLVEKKGEKKGVTIYGKDEGTNTIYSQTIKASDINGFYRNLVTMKPNKPTDDVQKIVTGSSLVDKDIISRRSFRDKWMHEALPDDEDERIALEQAYMAPEMAPKRHLKAIKKAYPDTWQVQIAGTPLQQVAQAEEDALAQIESGQAEQKPGPGQHRMPDGTIMDDAAMQPQGPPMGPGGPMGPMGPEGPPLGMERPAPLPPELMGEPPPPSFEEVMMQQPGGPGPMGPPPPGPQLEGLGPQVGPPERQGQLTPEELGIPPGTPPEVMAELLGRPEPTEEEILQQMAAQQGGLV
jgi:hypothetical protein